METKIDEALIEVAVMKLAAFTLSAIAGYLIVQGARALAVLL